MLAAARSLRGSSSRSYRASARWERSMARWFHLRSNSPRDFRSAAVYSARKRRCTSTHLATVSTRSASITGDHSRTLCDQI